MLTSMQQAVGRGPWAVGREPWAGARASASLRVLRGEKNTRRGLTLVELLVVISIMMILVAFALPRLRPATGPRRARETARMVNTFLNRARVAALESGRPCGVLFRPLDNPVNGSQAASTMLFQVEVPPPYAGAFTNSRVVVTQSGNVLTITATLDDFTNLVAPGDLIQLNGQGPWYPITAVAGGQLTAYVDPARLDRVPAYPNPVSFAILRQPSATGATGAAATVSMAAPLRLPTGMVVDLGTSGFNQPAYVDAFGYGGTQPDEPPKPVTIMFSPNGSVNRCQWFVWNAATGQYEIPVGSPSEPSEPIFLLIGRETQVGRGPVTSPDAPDDTKPNWQLPDSLWIVLSPQTGLTSVAENAAATGYFDSQGTGSPWSAVQGLVEVRKFAKQSQSMGGR